MNKGLLTITLVTSLFIFNACSQKKDSTEMAEEQNEQMIDSTATNNTAENAAEDASEFWIMAAQGSLKEIELAKLAQSKSTNKEVKMLAEHIITDHTRLQAEAINVASKNNLTVPTTLDDESAKKYEKLGKKSGAEFDEEWIECMVKDHEKEVKEFQDEMNDSKNIEVRNWASTTLPVLQKHLEAAKQIQSRMKKS